MGREFHILISDSERFMMKKVKDSDTPASASAEQKTAVVNSYILPLQLEAIHIYYHSASFTETSRRTGIPLADLSKMSKEAWWQKEIREIQREQTALENMKLTKLWGLTLEHVEEYLTKGKRALFRGQELRDDDGNLVYQKLQPAEIARLADILFNQRQLIRSMPTSISVSESKLEEIADKLSRIGEARKMKIVNAEGEDKNDKEN